MRPYLSIIIPAYNEEFRLRNTLPQLKTFLKRQSFSWEVVVVDDGSDDGTIQVVSNFFDKNLCRVIINESNQGKGYSVRRGVMEAQGELILLSDADLSTPLEDYYKLKAKLDSGFDIAIGSRSLPESNVTAHQAWYRENMGRSFNWFVKFIVLDDFIDTQCGFKLFPSLIGQRLFENMTIDRFSFDVEFLYLAKKNGYKIAEVPIEWHNVLESRVRIWLDAPKMLLDLFRIRLNDWFGKYEI